LSEAQIEALRAGAIYYGYETAEYKGYLIGVEKFRDVLMEARPMFEQQAAEAESFLVRDANPNWAMYIGWEQHHEYILFTVRKEGKLVGNMMFFLSPYPNTGGQPFAHDNGFWLDPDHRKGMLGKKMLDYAEDTLRRLGMSFILMGDKAPAGGPDLGPLMKRAGFKPVTRNYVKELDHGKEK
jgi:GNAT superfamily N-acetyltransferase